MNQLKSLFSHAKNLNSILKLALHRAMMKFQNCLLLLTVVAVNVGCVLTERHAFKIKVAYMNKMGNKMCLQTDFGDLPADHNLVDIGKPMNISGMDIIGQFCDEFRLSDHVTDILKLSNLFYNSESQEYHKL